MAVSLIFSTLGGFLPWLHGRLTGTVYYCAIGAELGCCPVAITLTPRGPSIVLRERWEREHQLAYEYAFNADMSTALRSALRRADEQYGDVEPFITFFRWATSLVYDLTPRLVLDLDPGRAVVAEWDGVQKATPIDLLRLCRLTRSFELIRARPTNGVPR